MRFLYLLIAAAFMMGSSICEAGDDKMCGAAASSCSGGASGSSGKNAPGGNESKALKRIDTDYSGERDSGPQGFRGGDSYDTFDQNTGLPDMVESDRYYGDIDQ